MSLQPHHHASQAPIRPGRVLYLVAAIVATVSVLAAGVSVWGLLTGFPFNATRVVGPGETQITLDAAGDYVIAYEPRSTLDGRVFDTGALPSMDVRVLAPAGDPVPVSAASGSFTYSAGSREGEVVAGFTVQEPGTYTFASQHPSGDAQPEVVFAVGPDTTGRFVLAIAGILGGGFLLFAAFVTALVTLIVRANAKSKARNAQAPPPRWSPPPPSWGAPS